MKLLHLGETCALGACLRHLSQKIEKTTWTIATCISDAQTPWTASAQCRPLASESPANSTAIRHPVKMVRMCVPCAPAGQGRPSPAPVDMPRAPNAQCSRQQHRWTSSSCRDWPLTPRADGWGVAAATMTTSSAAAAHMRSSTTGLRRYSVTAEWMMQKMRNYCIIPNSVLQRCRGRSEYTAQNTALNFVVYAPQWRLHTRRRLWTVCR